MGLVDYVEFCSRNGIKAVFNFKRTVSNRTIRNVKNLCKNVRDKPIAITMNGYS